MVRKRAPLAGDSVHRRNVDGDGHGLLQDEIARAVVLALFVPLIISSGGNSGSQATTMIIRAMALGEVTLARLVASDAPRNLSGLALGLILGL